MTILSSTEEVDKMKDFLSMSPMERQRRRLKKSVDATRRSLDLNERRRGQKKKTKKKQSPTKEKKAIEATESEKNTAKLSIEEEEDASYEAWLVAEEGSKHQGGLKKMCTGSSPQLNTERLRATSTGIIDKDTNGNNRARKGYGISQHHMVKVREQRSRRRLEESRSHGSHNTHPVECLDCNGCVIVEFPSLRVACRALAVEWRRRINLRAPAKSAQCGLFELDSGSFWDGDGPCPEVAALRYMREVMASGMGIEFRFKDTAIECHRIDNQHSFRDNDKRRVAYAKADGCGTDDENSEDYYEDQGNGEFECGSESVVGSQDTGDNEIGTNNAGQQTTNHEEAKKAGEFTTPLGDLTSCFFRLRWKFREGATRRNCSGWSPPGRFGGGDCEPWRDGHQIGAAGGDLLRGGLPSSRNWKRWKITYPVTSTTSEGVAGVNWHALRRRRADLLSSGDWAHRNALADRKNFMRAYDVEAKTGETCFVVRPPPPPDIGSGKAKVRVWEPATPLRDITGTKPYSLF